MEQYAAKIFRMRDPERLFSLALVLSPYADTEGRLRESPLKLLQDFFYPRRRISDSTATVARLVALMRGAGYLENKNVGGNRGDWVLHVPPGVQSLAGHEIAARAQLLADVMALVERWGDGKISDIIAILQAKQQK